MRHAELVKVPSRALGKDVYLWIHGHGGEPIVVFPSAAGMAHEWQLGGAVDVLQPRIDAGELTLYCVESNVSTSWTADHLDGAGRLAGHRRYERFVLDELMPFLRARSGWAGRVGCAGASFGAFYAADFTLKHPDVFEWALCLSGRYRTGPFLEGADPGDAYFDQPLAFVPNLSGDALEAVRRSHLTLVVGLGPYEGRCVDETLALAGVLSERGIPHHLDVWGHDVSHEWVWWRRQLAVHLVLPSQVRRPA